MKEVQLPSGAILKITVAPFKDSKALYQAVVEELKAIKIDATVEMNPAINITFYRDLLCTLLPSKKIEAALWECMKRSLYNDNRMSEATFEPVETRDDYLYACFEVAKENILPFMKSLYAEYAPLLGKAASSPS